MKSGAESDRSGARHQEKACYEGCRVAECEAPFLRLKNKKYRKFVAFETLLCAKTAK